jgi:6-phosphogluconolactonase
MAQTAGLTISPSAVIFDAQRADVSSPPQTLTLTNTTSAAFSDVTVTLSGDYLPSFSIAPADSHYDCGSLAVGAQCTMELIFTPRRTGSLGMRAVIVSTGVGTNSQTIVDVSGTGIGPTHGLSVSQTAIPFGGQLNKTTSQPRTLILTNTSAESLTVASPTLTGADSPSFAVVASDSCGTLAIGAQCTVNVTFTPQTTGPLADRIWIVSTATGGKQSQLLIPVSGVGIAQEHLYAADNIGGTIYGFVVEPTGALTATSPASTTVAVQSGSTYSSGSFLEPILGESKIDPSGNFLYVTDSGDNVIWGFAIDQSSGALSPLAASPFITGDDPVSLAFNPDGSNVYVANYSDGTISAYELDPLTGALGPQTAYPMGASGQLGFAEPTQIVAAGNYIYVADVGDSVIDVFAMSGSNTLTEQQNYPNDQVPYGIAVNPAGTLLYTANCGATDGANYCGGTTGGTVSAFQIAGGSGWLTGLSTNPLSIPVDGFIAVDSLGEFVLVPENAGVAVYAIGGSGPQAGSLVAVNNGTPSSVPADPYGPHSVTAEALDRAVYVGGVSATPTGYVWEFTFDSSNGALAVVPGETTGAAAGWNPMNLAIN